MSVIPIIISLVGLSVAIFTFYKTLLKPPDISVLIGPNIYVFHYDYPEISTGLYVPMTFVNSSPNIGSVFRCAISIFRVDEPEAIYFCLWKEFTVSYENCWKFDGEAHSFAVSGKTSVSRVALFRWLRASNQELIFKRGSYSVVVHLWLGRNTKPINTAIKFHVTQDIEDYLQNQIDNQSSDAQPILLNKDFDINRVLSIHEYKKLLE